MRTRDSAKRTPRAAQPITVIVSKSDEAIDFDEFLDAYARAIVEAKGTEPADPTAGSGKP